MSTSEPRRCGKCGGGHPCDCAGFTKMAPWESHVGEPSKLRPIKYLDDGPEGDPVEWLFAIASEGRPGDPVLRSAVEHYRDQQAVVKFLVKRAEAAENEVRALASRLEEVAPVVEAAGEYQQALDDPYYGQDAGDWARLKGEVIRTMRALRKADSKKPSTVALQLPPVVDSSCRPEPNVCPLCSRGFSTPQGLGLHFKAKTCGGKP